MAKPISIGDVFSSFQHLQNAIKQLEDETDTVFIRKDSVKTRMTGLKDSVIYDRVLFACKQGRERKPEGTGQRESQRSVKLGCSAQVRAVLKEVNGTWSFVLTKVNLEHDTHTPSKEALTVFPERKKIQKMQGMELLLGCPNVSAKDMVKVVEAEQGTRVLTKDIYNFRQKFRGQKSSDSSEVSSTLMSIVDRGGKVDFSVNDQGQLTYLSYVTKEMLTLASKFSEVLIMDITYKTNVYLLPLLTVMCVNNNGKGHPIFHSFLATEEQVVLVKALEFFKSTFDSTCTSCFFVDKDFSEIGALSIVFPGKALIVCAFHIATAVKKALCNKGLSAQQAETIKGLFMDMKDALTLEEFNALKTKLTDVSSQPTVDYFEANWFSKTELWAAHRQVGVGKLHVTTTNHCESYHQKIKQVLRSSLALSTYFLFTQFIMFKCLSVCTHGSQIQTPSF